MAHIEQDYVKKVLVGWVPIVGGYVGLMTLSDLQKRVVRVKGAEEIKILREMKDYCLCVATNTITYGAVAAALGYSWGSISLLVAGGVQLFVSVDQALMMRKISGLLDLLPHVD
jgi:hypothetical protein